MNPLSLPPHVTAYINAEQIDFAIQSGRAEPLKKSFSKIYSGVMITIMGIFFLSIYFKPLLITLQTGIAQTGVHTTTRLETIASIFIPTFIIGLMCIGGLFTFFQGISTLLKRGGYIIGTPTRLIRAYDNHIESIDWEQFSGKVLVHNSKNNGTLTLFLRTGKMVSGRHSVGRDIPDTVYISNIPNTLEVEKICQTRIKENDPTPPLVQ